MSRHAVHAALQPSNRINLGTFGPEPKADPAGYKAEDSAWPGGLVGNVADSDRVMQQRNADMLAGNPTRSINGPLPSADWDAFFGAMQRKESNAENHGLNFRPNIAGHGPGEGIGQLGFINGQGLTEHPLAGAGMHPSISALQNAASRINNPNRRF
jgi:hypothetical protein